MGSPSPIKSDLEDMSALKILNRRQMPGMVAAGLNAQGVAVEPAPARRVIIVSAHGAVTCRAIVPAAVRKLPPIAATVIQDRKSGSGGHQYRSPSVSAC